MKPTWTLALAAIGWIGLLASEPAAAQYGPYPSAAVRPVAYMSQAVPEPTPAPQPAAEVQPTTPAPSTTAVQPAAIPAPGPNVQAAVPAPTAAPDAIYEMPQDNSMLIDNGLWDGAPVGSCCAICGGGSGCPPDWYTEQGVRLLGRTRPREVILGSEPIGSIQGTPLFEAQLTNRMAAPDMSAAYAMTVGHYFARDKFNRDHFVEFSFWGLNGWKDEADATAKTTMLHKLPGHDTNTQFGSLVSPYFSTSSATIFMRGFDGANDMHTFSSSYNQNFEINGRFTPRGREDRLVLHPNGKWRRECQPGQYISYLYGIRYMQVDETFNFHSHSIAQPLDAGGNPVGDPTPYDADYDIVTHNNLLGLQVGADMMFRNCRWAWGVRSKVGAFVNFSDQVSSIVSPDLTRTGDGELSAAKHEASFIGEVGFTATYKFRPNLMGRAGYDFMWVTGLALAPEQFQFVPSPVNKINTNGSIFYHGISLGLEWMW